MKTFNSKIRLIMKTHTHRVRICLCWFYLVENIEKIGILKEWLHNSDFHEKISISDSYHEIRCFRFNSTKNIKNAQKSVFKQKKSERSKQTDQKSENNPSYVPVK